MTLNIMPLTLTSFILTMRKCNIRHNANAVCHCAECKSYVIKPSDIMLNVIMVNVVMLNVVMLYGVILNAVMLNVIMLNVVAS